MGMITEGQILRSTERTNELLAQLLVEQQRTDQLLEALFRSPTAAPTTERSTSPG